MKKIGQLAGLPGAAVAERLGPDGRRAWSLARGEDTTRCALAAPPAEIAERLEFPEAVGNELTLRRALTALLDRILARPERGGREIRKVALSARLVGGGSWRRTRDAARAERGAGGTAGGTRAEARGAPRAGALALGSSSLSLTECGGPSARLDPARRRRAEDRLREGLRQVRASAGAGAVATVVEVAPWSRIPGAAGAARTRDD